MHLDMGPQGPWSYTRMHTSPVGLGRKKGRGWDIPQSWGSPTSPEPSEPREAQAPSSGTSSCSDLFALTQDMVWDNWSRVPHVFLC